jgi:hypothetical protein
MVLTSRLCVVPGAKNKQRHLALHNISRLVLHKRGEECLLRGTHRVLIQNQTRLVFEGLLWKLQWHFYERAAKGKKEKLSSTYIQR